MPKPTCKQCGSTDSLLWRKQKGGQICNECYAKKSKEARPEVRSEDDRVVDSQNGDNTPANDTGRAARKSTRAARQKAASSASPRRAAPSNASPRRAAPSSASPRRGPPRRAASRRAPPPGRGRRSALKSTPQRAPTDTATLVTSDSIFFKGSYMQVGDVVSMLDVDGGTYYAQIRGFLTDQYCEKSAVVTWLLPTKASPPPEKCFDPATYIIGPAEELPRKLEYMEFVMHIPSDYYRADTPYPPCGAGDLDNCSGFVWTSMEPKERTQT